MVIAIDGTVSSGKSTIAKKLAEHLGFLYCNTGAIYRAITIKILNNKLTDASNDEIKKILEQTSVTMTKDDSNKIHVFLDGKDVSDEINSPKISEEVSLYSKIPAVREYVRIVQQKIARNGNAVIEGRDIGTVVFPNAELKIFMTADIDVRAQRRMEDYKKQGKNLSFDEVKKQVIARDEADMNRAISPLKPADDSVIYYNNGSDIEKVILDLAKLVKEKENKYRRL